MVEELPIDLGIKPTSDIANLPKQINIAKEAWKQSIEEEDRKQKEYDKNIKTIEQELGQIEWEYPIMKDDRGDPLPFKASQLTSAIIERPEYNVITDKNSQVVYLWAKKFGVYQKNGEQILRFIIDNVLGEESTIHKINETIELLKIRTFAEITPSPKIAVQNGLLDVITGKLEPHNEYEFVTNKLQTDYIENSKSEVWEKFIEQVCPNDKLLLQEWSGYLLIKGYPFHAIMWIYGPTGRNGKGTWSRTMQSILGPENYSAVSIDEFDGKHRFAIFNLHDSLFNICSEPRTDRMLTVEMLQSLSGQDDLDAERKGVQERFKFRNPAKMTVMGNKFPNVNKPTDAFWERLKLCKFPNRFTGKEQTQDLEKAWLEDPQQRAGVLNWMLEGAKRLLENHGFTMTQTQEETIIQFKRASDSIGAFIAECIEFDPKEITQKINAYELYKEYCEIINIPSDTNITFNKRLCDIPKIKETSARIGVEKKKTKVWKGFKLKALPESETDDIENEVEEVSGQKTLYDSTNNECGTTGTVGTDLPPLIPQNIGEKLENINIDIGSKSVPVVPTVPTTKDRVCGDCGRFHLASCGFPSGAFEKVPADWWANEMRCFIVKQKEMDNPGEDM